MKESSQTARGSATPGSESHAGCRCGRDSGEIIALYCCENVWDEWRFPVRNASGREIIDVDRSSGGKDMLPSALLPPDIKLELTETR